MKKIGLIILLILLAIGVQPEIYGSEIPKEKVVLVKKFPEDGLQTKAVPWIDVDSNGNIFAVGNREHSIFKFSPEGKLLLTFGGWGQGPGELQWPAWISINNEFNQIFIIDNIGISIYDSEGKFIQKIRTFIPPLSLCATRNGVILLQPTPDKKEMINYYDRQGRLILSCGEKYQIDYSLSKEIQPGYLDRLVNDGKILSDGKYIYYVSHVFGEIKVFDFSGKLILRKKITGIKNLEMVRREYEKLFFKNGIKKNKDGTITTRLIFDDSYISGQNIYLLMRGEVEKGPSEILSLSKDNLDINERLSLPEEITPKHLCIIKPAGTNGGLFLVAFYDKVNEINLIGIFKKGVSK
ncbi:MAG: 6-bladed beta-propeller [Candidatus Aminicenantes bacterium]|nr:6-bladed beta-propeller [Candidatus Aminicenantes bacterium]